MAQQVKNQTIGKDITENLSYFLLKYTTVDERKQVCNMDDVEVKYSTVRSVMFREIPVSERSIKPIYELIKIALKNSKKENEESKKAGEYLEELTA